MDFDNPVISLCMKGIQAEFSGRKERACEFYRQAWETAKDEYEACIAAHYRARCTDSPEEILHWNQLALDRANRVKDERVLDFFPSLYLNLGRSFELLGNLAEAQTYYDLAAGLGFLHRPD